MFLVVFEGTVVNALFSDLGKTNEVIIVTFIIFCACLLVLVIIPSKSIVIGCKLGDALSGAA